MKQTSNITDFSKFRNSALAQVTSDIINIDNNDTSEREEASTVDENKIIEKYLDKVDQDRRDQEDRISKNIQLMEQRITEERRLSEERMEKRFNDAMTSIKEVNSKIEKLEDKLDQKTNSMLEKIDSTNKWVIALSISTIIGIAAMVVTVILTGKPPS